MYRSLRNGILLALMVGIFVALVLEGTIRLLPLYKVPEAAVPRNIGQFNAMLGWSLKPLSYGVSTRTGYEVEYRINSKGLRSREMNYEKAKDKFRVVLIGDSNTFGYRVPIEKHFSTLLEGYFQDIEVINMGVSGFGVDQMLIYLKSEGFRYKPDLVLAYIVHYADHRHMHTVRFGKKKPRFTLTDGKLILINSPVIEESKPLTDFSWINHYLIKYSKLYQTVNAVLRSLGRREVLATPRTEEDKNNLKNEAFKKELYDLGEALVLKMHEEAINHGAVFILVTQIKELYEASLRRRMFSIDVSKQLSNSKFSLPNNLGHINESGNGVLAWEIAKFLQINQLIPVNHLKAE